MAKNVVILWNIETSLLMTPAFTLSTDGAAAIVSVPMSIVANFIAELIEFRYYVITWNFHHSFLIDGRILLG